MPKLKFLVEFIEPVVIKAETIKSVNTRLNSSIFRNQSHEINTKHSRVKWPG